MDRRYSEMKLDGSTASNRQSRQSAALVRSHLQRAKQQNRAVYAESSRPGSGAGFRAQASDDWEGFSSGAPGRRNRPTITRPEL